MNTTAAPTPSAPAPANPPDRRLRWLGILTLILTVAVSTVGGSLALEGSTYSISYLGGHVGLAVVLILVSAWAVVLSRRLSSRPARIAAHMVLGSAILAFVAGIVFLEAGQSNGALYAMEGFAGLAVLASLLLIVWGSVSNATSTALSPP